MKEKVKLDCLGCKFFISGFDENGLPIKVNRWCIFRKHIPHRPICNKFDPKKKGEKK